VMDLIGRNYVTLSVEQIDGEIHLELADESGKYQHILIDAESLANALLRVSPAFAEEIGNIVKRLIQQALDEEEPQP
jgi:hypothetical protein